MVEKYRDASLKQRHIKRKNHPQKRHNVKLKIIIVYHLEIFTV